MRPMQTGAVFSEAINATAVYGIIFSVNVLFLPVSTDVCTERSRNEKILENLVYIFLFISSSPGVP